MCNYPDGNDDNTRFLHSWANGIAYEKTKPTTKPIILMIFAKCMLQQSSWSSSFQMKINATSFGYFYTL